MISDIFLMGLLNFKKYLSVESLAMFAIVGLTIATQLIYTAHFNDQESSAEIINISGRQRMYSQRLARLALEYKKTKNPEIPDVSKDIVEKFYKTNETLLNDKKYNWLNTSQVNEKLLKQEKLISKIKQDLNCIYSRCPSSLFHYRSLLKKSENFLVSMESIVSTYETESKKNMKFIWYSELIFMTLISLLFAILGIRYISSVRKESNLRMNTISEKYNLTSEIERVANIGSWELDLKTEHTRWSDQVYKIHKVPIGTAHSKIDGINFYAEHDRERITQLLTHCIANKCKFDDSFDFYDANGDYRRVRSVGEPILNEEEEVVKVVGVFQDITESYKKEKELIEQRRMANLNAKLASIGQLAAGVGHEINNPLAIIKGYIEIIQERVEPKNPHYKDIIEKFEKCHLGIDRIAKIVMGLRTLSHSSEREGKVFSLNSVVENCLAMIKEIYQREGITIEFNSEGDSYIFGDEVEFSQVVMNLISNAKDATEGKEDRNINVDILNIDDSVVLKVEDNGKGISEVDKSKIFDPFFTTKGVNEGVGIGLSITHSIVKKIDGEIECDSSEKGTTFTLTFPSQMPIKPEKSDEMIHSNPEVIVDLKLLILDDEEEIRSILGEILVDHGFKVISFGEGEKAIEYLKENDVDVIISDIKMPAMTGEDFYKELSKITNNNPRFFFATGGMDSENEISEEVLNAIDGILYKPYDHETLVDAIKKSFDDLASKKVA